MTNEDELSVESTAADSALWEAVAGAAELDETDGARRSTSLTSADEAPRAAALAVRARESGADGPPVLRPASAAVGKPERRRRWSSTTTRPRWRWRPRRRRRPRLAEAEASEPEGRGARRGPGPAPPTEEPPAGARAVARAAGRARAAGPEPVEAPEAPGAPAETEQTPEQRGVPRRLRRVLVPPRHKHAAWFADPHPVGWASPLRGHHQGRWTSARSRASTRAAATRAPGVRRRRAPRLPQRDAFNTGADEPVHVAAVQLGAKFEERFESAMEDALYESSDEEEDEEEEEPARRRR